jgi:hypothetical protein
MPRHRKFGAVLAEGLTDVQVTNNFVLYAVISLYNACTSHLERNRAYFLHGRAIIQLAGGIL